MSDPNSRRDFLARVGQASAAAALTPLLTDRIDRPGLARPRPASPATEDDWRRIRKEFLPSERTVSINAANMCPAPRSVVTAIEQATADVDRDVSYQNRAKYNEIRDTTRARLARLIGADPDEIAIVRNASEANNILVGGLDLGRDDEVLILDQNHPTNNVAWDVRAARRGFSVKRVGFTGTPGSVDEVLSKFTGAATARTRVIGFSHVSNSSGLKVPAAELIQWARGRGIHVHVDGAQTFAAMPLDLHALGCDSFSASAQKWLMGPREAGFLYLRSDRLPSVWPGVIGVGWGDQKDPAVKGARKFETMGQRNDATFAGLAAAIEFHERLGPARVSARIGELTGRLIAGLTEAKIALVTPTDPALRLGVVVIKADPARAARLHESLYRDHGIIGSNTGGLRLSPNVCITMADVDRAVAAVIAVSKQA